MWDHFVWQDVPIPPRESYQVSIAFEDSRILPRFYLGADRVRPLQVREPALRPLVHSVRADGTLSLHSFLSFNREYEYGVIPPDLVRDMDPILSELTLVEPSSPVLHFMFDGEAALIPLAESEGVLFAYDGKGIFLSEEGTWFHMREAETIDPYLRPDRKIGDGHFGLFFKLVYPRISQTLSCYSSLTFTQKSPVLFSPRVEDDIIRLEVAWQVDPGELLTFPNNSALCEYRGELYYHSDCLKDLPEKFKTDGDYPLTPNEASLFRNMSRAAPKLFTAPVPAATLTIPANAFVIPKRDTTVKVRNLSVPEGATCTLSPVRPLNAVRSAHTHAFIKRYGDAEGPEVPLVPYSAFTPSFADLKPDQRAPYLYARAAYLRGEAVKVDYTYLLLLVYEALNRNDRYEFLIFLWLSNRERFRRLDSVMPPMLRDYIVLWDLPIPLTDILRRVPFDLNLIPHAAMFLDLSTEDAVAALPFYLYPTLSSYEYAKSKAYSAENAEEYHLTLQKALIAADRHLRSVTGKGLWQSHPGTPTKFRALLCSPAALIPENGYEANFQYINRTGDPTLKNFVGQIFKLADNLYREAHGIRGKLRVELEPQLADAIKTALTPKKENPSPAPIPAITLDIKAAMELEQDSWRTTDRLIAAAGVIPEEEPLPEPDPLPSPAPAVEPIPTEMPADDSPFALLSASLSPAEAEYLSLLYAGADEASLFSAAQRHLAMPDTLVEGINEHALEAIGDILIEAGEILEDYREELAPYLST
ncbi:MAG: hypothetical protein IKZ21_02080 [Clostridia bacterium]|nr:hypothetical protein [Clostridia bacterium]